MKKAEALVNNKRIVWNEIPWRIVERKVFKLQKRIYKASSRGDVKTVRGLQKILMKSWYAQLLAVRRVSQDNQGKKTAGVDGVKSLSPESRLKLAQNLKLNGKARPTRRVWIPKPGKEEKRPLGIPTMYDRALQALAKLALEPEWEAKFEPNSYGFRPGRSCHDAIEAIFIAINDKPKYVLDADISKCFDCINHEQLLGKLNTYPSLRRQIRAWLKAGVMDGKELFPTAEGTPQVGVISPLLANIALHGMENRVKEFAKTINMKRNGKEISWQNKVQSLNLIRYADVFVVMHEDKAVVEQCEQILKEWLAKMGLELKPSKTRLIHTLNSTNGQKPGLDFLGFYVRQHSAGKNQSKQGFRTIIEPSKAKIKEHYEQIARVIEAHKAAPQESLIRHLNPIIRGWANYYSTVSSSKAYDQLRLRTHKKLMAWARFRHNKTISWIIHKYWHKKNSSNWSFSAKKENEYIHLLNHSEVHIKRYTKVKSDASPYDGNLIYWSSRMGQHPEMNRTVGKLLKRQNGKAAQCGLYFKSEDIVETDHIVPKSKGGRDVIGNFQLLHRHCHDTKTQMEFRSVCDKHRPIEEPDEGKLSRPVLKTSQRGDSLA